MSILTLDADDRKSHTWKSIKAQLIALRDDRRARNDSTSLSETDTAALRGEIRLLSALIRSDEDRPAIET